MTKVCDRTMDSARDRFVAATDRRGFLGGIGAAAFLAMFGFDALAGERRLRFGVISDIHVWKGRNGKNLKGADRFKEALRLFRARDVDAVMIAGDLTERGVNDEMKMVADAWFEVFPDDKGLNGKPVTRLITTGNHDFGGFNLYCRGDAALREKLKADSMEADPAAFWTKYWHEPYAENFTKTVNGYTFVFSHCFRWKDIGTYLDGLNLNPNKPFFYCLHLHPEGTVYAHSVSRAPDYVTRALERHPNAIVFSGHTHEPLNDPSAVWQGAFTSVATGAVSQLFIGREKTRENYMPAKGTDETRPLEMPRMRLADGSVAQIVDVFDDRMVLEAVSLAYGCRVREDIVVPFPSCRDDASRPYRFSPRRETDLPPEFPSGATVSVSFPKKPGKDRDNRSHPQTVIAFDRATPRSGGLRDYEILVERRDGDGWKQVLSRRVFALWFYLPEAKARELMSEKKLKDRCVIASADLPKGEPLRIRVTPYDFWGKPGKELTKEVTIG